MATVGLVPTVFGSLMNITGATLATFWRDKPPRAPRVRQEVSEARIAYPSESVPS